MQNIRPTRPCCRDAEREAERAERLRRVAELATLPKVTTAARMFTEAAAREATERARTAQEQPQ